MTEYRIHPAASVMSDRIPADFALRVDMGQSDSEIADAVGVSSRTVLRWRRKLSLASRWTPPVPEHGTPGRYARGCTCDVCRMSETRRKRAYVGTRTDTSRSTDTRSRTVMSA